MSSDGAWGELAEQSSELADAWDAYAPLPEPGDNEALDAFTERKQITIAALVRLGARLSAPDVIAFPYSAGIKYRNLVTDRRWSYLDSEFPKLKLVPAGAEQTERVIVAEGETDGARLTELYDCDVAIMGAGARRFTDAYAEQLAPYTQVLVGLDNDEAGEAGAQLVLAALPQAVRFAPAANDWCSSDGAPELPVIVPPAPEIPLVVNARELLELEAPEIPSWFEHDILPIGGLLMLHGWAKSFKTFLALDMLSALAQCQDWAGFEPMEEPCRVAVVQFELPWGYYKRRIAQLSLHATERELFEENFLTFAPMSRPRLTAGNAKQEAELRNALIDGGAQVVLIDPIRRATGDADLNSEAEVRRMLAFFQSLNDEGMTVVATHHDNKDSAKHGGGDMLGMTGSGAWAGDPDTIVSIGLPHGEELASPRRNLHFSLRHSPALGPRGMEIGDGAQITYSPSAHGMEEEVEVDDPSLPAI